jgi:hypothetical protein
MAQIMGLPNVVLKVAIQLDEGEARALEAMAGYGDDAFVKVFYEHLGKAYMQEHEQSLRSLLKSVRKMMSPLLSKTDDARRLFHEKKEPACDPPSKSSAP